MTSVQILPKKNDTYLNITEEKRHISWYAEDRRHLPWWYYHSTRLDPCHQEQQIFILAEEEHDLHIYILEKIKKQQLFSEVSLIWYLTKTKQKHRNGTIILISYGSVLGEVLSQFGINNVFHYWCSQQGTSRKHHWLYISKQFVFILR